jgi:cysteine desulfurase
MASMNAISSQQFSQVYYNSSSTTCILENTLVRVFEDNIEQYIPVQNIRKGTCILSDDKSSFVRCVIKTKHNGPICINNEIGIIQPITEIGEIAQEHNISFFCDATQAVGKVKVDVQVDNIDMLCFSGHKLNGPKGIGVLYKKNETELTPLLHGGGQEKGLRAGTLNTPLIVGLGKACEIISEEIDEIISNLFDKNAEIERYYEENNIGIVNFKNVKKAPHILSITLNDYKADDFLILKSKEFVASTGSACNSSVITRSHVLQSLEGNKTSKIIRISI